MVWASIERLLSPRAIAFDEALFVAVLGLLVNLLSAWLLVGSPAAHGHDHGLESASAPAGEHGHGPRLVDEAALGLRRVAAVRVTTCARRTCTCWRTP
jgi:Co/Zn/Cd efflux system component